MFLVTWFGSADSINILESFTTILNYFEKPAHFSMLESKLWQSKTGTKNVKVAEMVKFIKSCDQYRPKFNFDYFFQLRSLPRFNWGK